MLFSGEINTTLPRIWAWATPGHCSTAASGTFFRGLPSTSIRFLSMSHHLFTYFACHLFTKLKFPIKHYDVSALYLPWLIANQISSRIKNHRQHLPNDSFLKAFSQKAQSWICSKTDSGSFQVTKMNPPHLTSTSWPWEWCMRQPWPLPRWGVVWPWATSTWPTPLDHSRHQPQQQPQGINVSIWQIISALDSQPICTKCFMNMSQGQGTVINLWNYPVNLKGAFITSLSRASM